MADDYAAVLAHEFAAGDGSFLLQLRTEMTWDKVAFTRLTEAMLACCRAYDQSDIHPTFFVSPHDTMCLPRWLVDGFWYVSHFVRDWTTHPAWKERTAPGQDYYDRAYDRLFWLAEWFFTGHCPFTDPAWEFAPM